MDVVLELFDTFLLDRLYASAFPITPSAAVYHAFDLAQSPNRTWSGLQEAGVGSMYKYQPASSYLSFQPSAWAHMSQWPRDNAWRQLLSLYMITWIFGVVIYFVCATASYVFIFDKTTTNHPKYLKNQISLEIKQTMVSMPMMAIFTAPFFLAEVRGYSKMYDTTADGPGMWYNFFQFPLFLCFTDFFIYWIHRGLHHPMVYKRLHKPHHKWIMPTPFASHAFHWLDGYAQSVPYHVFPFIFPLQKFAYVALFMFINIWTVLIHDGEYVANNPIINGAACHSIHHEKFEWNYGQFTTLWDRVGGSYRKPPQSMFERSTPVAVGKKKPE
ncbi:c-5 sterol desaturase [Elasticomyces elasticus]|nr:c-5 sterol desaturase [Elasticomyces elasticus]